MTPNVQKYMELSKQLLAAQQKDDEAEEDRLMDLMDPVWYALTDEEESQVNELVDEMYRAAGLK